MKTRVSIITPAFTIDRINDIKQLLDSVAAQSSQNLEMIIVVEKPPELAKSILQYIREKNYSGITVTCNNGPGSASAARNMGIRLAKGDIFAFVDDDAVLSSDWVEEITRTFDEDESVIGVTGPIFPLWQNAGMTWFPQEFYWIFSCTHDLHPEKIEVRNGYGTNLAFKREAFQFAGLFNPELGVRGRGHRGWQEPGLEEPELCLRVKRGTGKRIIYNPRVKVHHHVYTYRMTARFILRRAFWEGYGKALLNDKYQALNLGNNVLNIEYALLRRIILHRLPQSLKMLFRHPGSAFRQSVLILTVLTCVAVGYGKYKLLSWFRPQQKIPIQQES